MDSNDTVLRAAEMLERMRDKAMESVLAAYEFKNNTVNGCVYEIAGGSIGESTIWVRFSLNGREVESRFKVRSEDIHSRVLGSRKDAWLYLIGEVKKHVADAVELAVGEYVAVKVGEMVVK